MKRIITSVYAAALLTTPAATIACQMPVINIIDQTPLKSGLATLPLSYFTVTEPIVFDVAFADFQAIITSDNDNEQANRHLCYTWSILDSYDWIQPQFHTFVSHEDIHRITYFTTYAKNNYITFQDDINVTTYNYTIYVPDDLVIYLHKSQVDVTFTFHFYA
jgi:hypothetical protein